MGADTDHTKKMTLRVPYGLLERIQQEVIRRRAKNSIERSSATAIFLEAADQFLRPREKTPKERSAPLAPEGTEAK